jgi:hypothetical protein
MISTKLEMVFSSEEVGNFNLDIAKTNFGSESFNNNSRVESIGRNSTTKSFTIGFEENWENFGSKLIRSNSNMESIDGDFTLESF